MEEIEEDSRERYESVRQYLVDRSYPTTSSKKEKRAIRKQAESFSLKDGVLYHNSVKTNKLARVVMSVTDRDNILRSLHSEAVGGGHFGQRVTFDKVSERYWWRGVSNDVRDVRLCTRYGFSFREMY